MIEIRSRAHACSWTASICNVGEHCTGIARTQTLDPRDHKLRFAQCQAVVVRKLAVTGNCCPWRHVTRNDIGPDFSSLQPGLFVRLHWKRRTLFNVTHHAMFVEDPHDLAIEKHCCCECFMREGALRYQDACRRDANDESATPNSPH